MQKHLAIIFLIFNFLGSSFFIFSLPVGGQSDPVTSLSMVETDTISIGSSDFKDIAISNSELFVADGKNGIAAYFINSQGHLVPSFRISGDGLSDFSGIAVDENYIVSFDSFTRSLIIYNRGGGAFESQIPVGTIISNLRGMIIFNGQVVVYGNGIAIYEITTRFPQITNNSVSVYDLVQINDSLILLTNFGLLEYDSNSLNGFMDTFDQISFNSNDRLVYNGTSLIIFSQGTTYIFTNDNLFPIGSYGYEINQIVNFQNYSYLINSQGTFLLDSDYRIIEQQRLWASHLIQKLLFQDRFAYVAQGVMGINIFTVSSNGTLKYLDNIDLPSNNVKMVETSVNSVLFSVIISEYDRIRMYFDLEDSYVDFIYPYEVTGLKVVYPFIYLLNSTHLLVLEYQNSGFVQVRYSSDLFSGSSLSISEDLMVIVNKDAIRLFSLASPASPLLLDTLFISDVLVARLFENRLFYATNREVGQINIGFNRFTGSPKNVTFPSPLEEINGMEITNESIFLTGFSQVIVKIGLPMTDSSRIESISEFDVGLNLIVLTNQTLLLVTATQLILVDPLSLNFTSNLLLSLISFDAAFLISENFAIILANGVDGYSLLKFPPITSPQEISSPPNFLNFLLAILSLLVIFGIFWLWKFFSKKKRHQSPILENDYFDI